MGGKGKGFFRNIYKGHMDKTKGGRFEGRRWGWLGWGKWWGEKCRQLYLNNNKRKLKKTKHTYTNK